MTYMYLLQTGRHILLYHVKPFPLFSGIQLFASGHLLVTKKNKGFFYCNTAHTSIYKFQKVNVQTPRQDQEKTFAGHSMSYFQSKFTI